MCVHLDIGTHTQSRYQFIFYVTLKHVYTIFEWVIAADAIGVIGSENLVGN